MAKTKETKAENEVAIPATVNVPVEVEKEEVAYDGIEVGDPQVLRPVELPLVVKPTGGSWANEAQEEYAKYLNAYAYKNTKKWEKKKPVLLKRLSDLAKNPDMLMVYRGIQENLEYKNKLIQN